MRRVIEPRQQLRRGSLGRERNQREFGRMRPLDVALGIAAPQTAMPAAAIQTAPLEPSVMPPIDMPKVFLGPNATWYDERWRWMDWRGRSYGWNWAAAGSFGGWLAYRRMYRQAGIYLAWVIGLCTLAAAGLPLGLVAAALLASALALGVYGNTLYLQHFKRVARDVGRRHDDHPARLAALVQAGGVDRYAPWVMGALELGLVLLLVQVNRWLFGELYLHW